MSLNDKLLKAAAGDAPGGITPSEHFGVVLYEGDGKSGRSVNGGKFGAGATFGIEKSTTQATDSRITTTYYAKNVGSISGWLKKNGNTSELEYVFVTKDDTGSAHQLGINLLQEGDSDLSARVGNGSSTTNVNTSGLTLNNDAWHHYVVTWNLPNGSNNVKVYVDGSLEATGSQSTGSWTGNSSRTFQLGHYTNTNTNNGFAGMQDQVRVFEKELSSSEVSTLYAETADTVTSLDPLSEDTTDTLQVLSDSSCVAAYRFENNEDDLSGNYNGTGTQIQYAAGRYGQAASFNGSASYIDPNGDWGVNGDSSHSVSFWVNFNSSSGTQHFYGIGDIVTAFTHTSLYIDSGLNTVVHDNNGNADNLATSLGLSTGQWYHFVLTYNSSDDGLEFYLNGVSKGTATRTLNVTGDAVIGRRPYYATNYLNADLDQFRVFNKELSASEVTTLYQENSLLASYRFEGNSNDDRNNFNGSDNDIFYEYGLNFTPDFVWIKRTDGAENNYVQDSTRGSTKQIYTNLTNAEFNETGAVSSFDTGGWTMGSYNGINNSDEEYVAFCWKANGGTTESNTDGSITGTVQANTDAGFSIVSYDSSGNSSGTIGHGLGVKPGLVINKNRDSDSTVWVVNTDEIDGSGDYLILNTDAAKGDAYTAPTATTIGSIDYATNDKVISYCFASIDGFSKIGIYTGNGSDNGPIVETGFEPAWLMVKGSSNTGSWLIFDNKRNTTNPRNKVVRADSNAAETTSSTIEVDFLSNGFQLTGTDTDYNGSGRTYIFMCFAADADTEAPAVAKSFTTRTYTGDGTYPRAADGSDDVTLDFGFPPGLVWGKSRDDGTLLHVLVDRVRGNDKQISTNLTDAEATKTSPAYTFDGDTLVVTSNGNLNNNDPYVAWAWKADDNEPTIKGGPALAVYKFEDNLNDVTGNNNSNASASITYNSSGKFNKSVDFNGTSSYFTVSSLNNLFDTWTSISYSLWIKTTDSSAQFLVGTATDEQNYKALASISSGKLTPVTRKSGTVYSASSSTSINDGNWHHIVITYDNDNGITKGYVDGVEEVSFATGGSSSGSLTIHNVSVGANYQSGNGNFYNGLDGEIDQLRFYNGVINDIGVAALYAETASDNDDLTLGAPKETIISANANAGFSIIKYTGDGQNGNSIPHGLSATPTFWIIKQLTGTQVWLVGSDQLSASDNYLILNQTNAETTNAPNIWSVDSTKITFDTSYAGTNNSGDEYIMYAFHSVSGFSKFGSYSGNNTGQTITTGFQPDFLMLKKTNVTSEWWIMDSVRGTTNNLEANTADAENTGISGAPTFVSTGFNFSGSTFNETGTDWIYVAFKIN